MCPYEMVDDGCSIEHGEEGRGDGTIYRRGISERPIAVNHINCVPAFSQYLETCVIDMGA